MLCERPGEETRRPDGPERVGAAGKQPVRRLPGVAAPGTVGAPDAAAVPQDTVAWIHQRIAAIQQEREAPWQKIVKILPGMS
jgi:hypothetical protein